MTEIVTCPACAKKLQVPEDFFGKTVQCPECKQQFVANPAGAAPAPPSLATHDLFPARQEPSYPVEEDDDGPRRPRKRRNDDDDRPSRRDRLAPHRGGMILAFGILAIIGIGAIVFGPLAWFLGNADLAEMRAGRMDPSGEGQTNTGRILGMIATLLIVVTLVAICGLVIFLLIVGIVSGGAGRR
jgi:hypothetical protein